jgi:opacity protein-like surface antigen
MMKRIIFTSSLFALMTIPAFASAQDAAPKAYVGGNYVFVTYDEDGFAEDIDMGALVAKVGAKINPYVSAELRAGFGVADDSATVNGVTGEIEVDYLVGGYGVLGIPNETPVYPYVVLGFTKGELTASVRGPGGSASASASETDFSYGVGANFDVSTNVQMNAEYMNYIDKDGAEISGISLGASYLF